MENSNKVRLSGQELETLVHEAFGQSCRSAAELTDGWANMAYSIRLADGRTVVLKIAPGSGSRVMRYEKNMMKTEVEAMRLVSGTPELPVPRIFTYDATCTLIPNAYFFMEHVEGTAFNKVKSGLPAEVREGIERQLGRFNRMINAYRGSHYGSLQPDGRRAANWADAFEGMMADVLADGKDAEVVFPVTYAEIEKEFVRSRSLLGEAKEASLVHWDLWDGNVLVHDGRITGLIDFERAYWGDPLSEFYFGRFAADAANSFNAGYGIGGLTEFERRRRVLYDFYLDLILVIECAYRNYENRDHIKWTLDNFREGFKRLQAL